MIIQLQALKDNGIECNYVTGGGTGSFPYEAGSGVFTEVQPVSLYMYNLWPVSAYLKINWINAFL